MSFRRGKLKTKPWPNGSECEQAKLNKSRKRRPLSGGKEGENGAKQLATAWTASSAARDTSRLNESICRRLPKRHLAAA
ncbi:hypothetical protein AVEN_89989-1 [Araneus ventricosus]|uniref:Uncharacterized protein n=1 Tax=Araneus ventricosus TaxID=182803 RepID=A0A4Y2DBU5_ARAVE|nr:hypothetical protein AVEN_89989-1 [Araneus ventricosus]